MRIVHLMASPFFGGPERQVLGLARHLPRSHESLFITFAERGKAAAFLDQVHSQGFDGWALKHNFPELRGAVEEIGQTLRNLRADILCCSGYKPDLLGWRAARQVGIPVIAIAHGWTGATWKVRLYESFDRLVMRWMDAVVAVSGAQAVKVQQAGIPEHKVAVIANAIDEAALAPPDPAYAKKLRELFSHPPRLIVGAAGRLSPEKGFDQLIAAAASIIARDPSVGFVLFGEGPLRRSLIRQVEASNLRGRFVMAGFREDVQSYLPHLDMAVLSSHTEGLPVILLESCAAGVATVATAVGGVPEVIEDGFTGVLVPPGNPEALAEGILDLLANDDRRRRIGQSARDKVSRDFTFTRQSELYQRLFTRLCGGAPSRPGGKRPRILRQDFKLAIESPCRWS